MGLFGSSPQKKLEKARGFLAVEAWYDALRLFDEALESAAKLGEGERSEARAGRSRCRREMMMLRLEEAEALLAAGDPEGARDRAQTAADLAEPEFDTSALRELQERIDAPVRGFSGGRMEEEMAQDDLLPEGTGRAPLEAHLLPAPVPEVAALNDAEFYGEDPAALFELHLESMSPRTAELFRQLGPDFRLGYLATVGGDGARAMQKFDSVDWIDVRHPAALRAKANALLLAGRAEECLQLLDAMAPAEPDGAAGEGSAAEELEEAGPARSLPDGVTEEDLHEFLAGEGERRYLRVEALRALQRLDEAVEAARSLADAQAEPRLTTEALLGWTLIEAGRAREAWDRLKPKLGAMGYHEEILVPAAQAAVLLGNDGEARRMLEDLIQFRMERSLVRGQEIDFPIEAGRKLLELYLRDEEDAAVTRTLVLHLVDHDAARAEEYRSVLLALESRG
jgi:hypothetical protein